MTWGGSNWCNPIKLPVRLKFKIYRILIHLALPYGAKCWPYTSRNEQTLHVTEMRMLRWTPGFTRMDWVRNLDVRNKFGAIPIQDKMLKSCLRWYDYFDMTERRLRYRSCTPWMGRIGFNIRKLELEWIGWVILIKQADLPIQRDKR